MKSMLVVDLGTVEYEECLSLQRRLLERRLTGEIEDTLLLLEHKPIITVGSSGGSENLLVSPEVLERSAVKLQKTDRGGNITYHGPGQLVGYPIFDLRDHGKDVHLLLRNLEQVVIDSLAEYGIIGVRSAGLTGVWVGEDKICSIGVAVRKWISYHGFAVNVNPSLEHWSLIHPCGLVGKQVTSISKLLGHSPGMNEFKNTVMYKCAEVFGLKPIQISVESLEERLSS